MIRGLIKCFFPKTYCFFKSSVFLSSSKTTSFYGPCYISVGNTKARLEIGDNFICNSGWKYSLGRTFCSKIVVSDGATLSIGNHSGISNTLIYCRTLISIGSFVNIGDGVMIFDSNFHSLDWRDRLHRTIDVKNAKSSPIIIEDSVFIGANSIICKGVTIGRNSIIAAGSVVVKSIPANCLAGGNPCLVIRHL